MQFLLWSPIGAALARCLGISSVGLYIALYVGVPVAAFATILVVVARRHGPHAMRAVLVLIAVAPVTTVLLAWQGSYDVFTVALLGLAVLNRSPHIAALVGLLLSFAAFEQGAIALAILVAFALAGVWGEVRPLLWTMAGLGVGALVLWIWLRVNGVRHSRSSWLAEVGIGQLVEQASHQWPLLLVSLVGATLPIVLVTGAADDRRRRCVLAFGLLAPLAPMLVTMDQTRVYSVLAWPVLLVLTIRVAVRTPDVLPRLVGAAVLLGIVVPGFFVWGGDVHLADWGVWHLVITA